MASESRDPCAARHRWCTEHGSSLARGTTAEYVEATCVSHMPATPSDLFAFLDRLGIAHQTVTHPALFTVEQSRALRGTIPGGHTKNLFLRDKKGALFLVSAV